MMIQAAIDRTLTAVPVAATHAVTFLPYLLIHVIYKVVWDG